MSNKNMSNIEIVANTMIPNMVKGIILIGIIVCLISITVAVYSYLSKKQSLKVIISYLSSTFGISVLVILSGLLVNFLANFDINFSSYKQTIPVGYIISLVGFFLLAKVFNKTNWILEITVGKDYLNISIFRFNKLNKEHPNKKKKRHWQKSSMSFLCCQGKTIFKVS